MCPGLFLGKTLSDLSPPQAPVLLYHYDALDPAQNASSLDGPRTIEAYAIWGPEWINGGQGAPTSYYEGGINRGTVPVMQNYWVSFMRSLDLNRFKHAPAVEWMG